MLSLCEAEFILYNVDLVQGLPRSTREYQECERMSSLLFLGVGLIAIGMLVAAVPVCISCMRGGRNACGNSFWNRVGKRSECVAERSEIKTEEKGLMSSSTSDMESSDQ